MIIERLNEKDICLYKDLIDEAFEGSNKIDFYKQYNVNANYIIVVAKLDNIIVGSITMYKLDLFTFSFQPMIEIFNVAVLKKYRGKKIGKQLFEYAKLYAKENGYKTICLTCLDTATDAHKLYESIGMKRTSSIKYSINIE